MFVMFKHNNYYFSSHKVPLEQKKMYKKYKQVVVIVIVIIF